MLSLQGNWIDFLILIILAFYVFEGWERGFWVLLSDLASFVGSLILALRFYPAAAKILAANFSFPNAFANAIGFLLVAFISEPFLFLLARRVLEKLPKKAWQFNKPLGILPSLANGAILIAFFLTLFVALPIKPQIKNDITNSQIGGYLVSQTVRFERQLADIFGGAIQDSLTYFTIQPESRERVNLQFQAPELRVDAQAEAQMFALVNQERRKAGVGQLVWDGQIVAVARAHSRDMFARKYFSHINPDGEDPGDRLKEGGVSFTLAAENLALAPTVTLAHQGLMDSEGHRRNILDPALKRIGIGVIDGEVYGKMFTQNFVD